jgi:hypothetical protein
MKTISPALLLAICLAASAVAAADEFTTDKPSPLKLTRAAGGKENVVRFTGTVRIAGRFLAAWEGLGRKPRYLRVTFRPDGATAGLLPHAAGGGDVTELMLTNNEQAATLLLGPEAAGKLLAKTVLSAEGDATVTIGDYQTVVD